MVNTDVVSTTPPAGAPIGDNDAPAAAAKDNKRPATDEPADVPEDKKAKADDAAAAELQAEPAADEVNREDGVAPEFETETEPVADKHAGDDSRDEDDIDPSELAHLDQSNIIEGGRRTRGKKIDYASLAKDDDEDDDEDDEDAVPGAEGEEGEGGDEDDDDEENDEE